MKFTASIFFFTLVAGAPPSYTVPDSRQGPLGPELPPAAVPYGLSEVVPGVIGGSIRRVHNKGFLEGNRVSRLNEKLKNRVPTRLSQIAHNAKAAFTGLIARSVHTYDVSHQFASHSIANPNNGHVTPAQHHSHKDPGPTVVPTQTPQVTYIESMQNKLTYYLLNITLGTPLQQFMVQIDTGSSDLWVPSRIIQFNGFDPKHSNTFHHLGDDFSIRYVKDSAQGFWGIDNFAFGGQNGKHVNSLQFAVATSAPDATMGILGIGPRESEVSSIEYPNLPFMLAYNKMISKPIYSMYMGGLEDSEGTILFGGSDKAKYRELTTLPLVSKSTIQVQLDSITLTSDPGPYKENQNKEASQEKLVSQAPFNVLLDTGTSLTYLPPDIVNTIATTFGASFESDVGMFVVQQDNLDNNPLQGMKFQFQNQVIYVPKYEIFWPLSWFSLEPSPYYAMTLLPSDTSMGYQILGDSFLRNAYIIYDLEDREVHLGQYYPCENSHVVAL